MKCNPMKYHSSVSLCHWLPAGSWRRHAYPINEGGRSLIDNQVGICYEPKVVSEPAFYEGSSDFSGHIDYKGG